MLKLDTTTEWPSLVSRTYMYNFSLIPSRNHGVCCCTICTPITVITTTTYGPYVRTYGGYFDCTFYLRYSFCGIRLGIGRIDLITCHGVSTMAAQISIIDQYVNVVY